MLQTVHRGNPEHALQIAFAPAAWYDCYILEVNQAVFWILCPAASSNSFMTSTIWFSHMHFAFLSQGKEVIEFYINELISEGITYIAPWSNSTIHSEVVRTHREDAPSQDSGVRSRSDSASSVHSQASLVLGATAATMRRRFSVRMKENPAEPGLSLDVRLKPTAVLCWLIDSLVAPSFLCFYGYFSLVELV